jgi:ribonuclease D
MKLINNQEDFNKICHMLMQEPIIFVDTEFYRRQTYFAKLSIIQIATKSEEIIIDALSGINLGSLKSVFSNESIIKVFHSPDQDFEIFYQLFGELPRNVFDTQIAASVCNIDDEMMGYGRLCKRLLDIEVDKTLQKANWMKRPLSTELLEYAIRDTEYLIPLYGILSKMIDEQQRWTEYKARITKLLDLKNYKPSVEKLIKKFKIPANSEPFRKKLKVLIQFREECAMLEDLPRTFCATNGELIQICNGLPTNDKELISLNLHKKPIAKAGFKIKLFELCEGLKAETGA